MQDFPSNGSYYQSNETVLPGDMTVLVSNDTLFNGMIVEHKPVDDHPDVMKDVTIFGVVQQIVGNDGYIVAKGINDQIRDFGVYLRSSKQQIWVPYRTVGGSRDIIIFNDVVVADSSAFHSVAAVVDSVNNRCILYLDGNVVDTKSLIGEPEFNPGVSHRICIVANHYYSKQCSTLMIFRILLQYNSLFVGGRPGTNKFRFNGTIRYLAIQDAVLSHGVIINMHNEMFGQTAALGTVNYCTNYTTLGEPCRLGNESDFR